MDISCQWLQDYINEDLPKTEAVAKILTRGAYEVESLEKVGDDSVLDVDVLPNRASDSLSHEGVARELSVLSNLSFSPVESNLQTDKEIKTKDAIRLSVGTDNCRRALKRLAMDVEVTESPDWLKKRLETLGYKSINNVVDITNFLMLELGQPVHAFDYDKLSGDKPKEVTIRPAQEGEEITTLDGDTFTLESGMLVIADNEKPLDIAGLKGGQVSGIDSDTTRVMLSACSFDPTTIRRTSQKLNLRTDASKRFENDVPAAGVKRAMDRFSELMSDLTNAKIAQDVLDVYPRPVNDYKVGVSTGEVNDLLGISIEESEITDILTRLGCEVESVVPREFVIKQAEEFVGIPYEYGASVTKDAPEKFDCSSFISWLYVQTGVALPRMSGGQFAYTEGIKESDLEPGDIVFSNTKRDEGGEIYYETREYIPGTEIPGGVDHCGIYLGDGKVIHASRHNHAEDGGVEVELLAEAEQFKNITKYGRVPEADQKRLVVTIPNWRTDLRISQDLIEEVGRVYGYEEIAAVMPKSEAIESTNPLEAIRTTLVGCGLSEVKTYSLIDKGEIKLTNPVAENKAYLRTTLRGNLKEVLDENSQHLPVLKTDNLGVFEIGKVFTADSEAVEIGVAIQEGTGQELSDIFAQVDALFDTDISAEVKDGIATARIPDLDSLKLQKISETTSRDLYAAVDFQTPSAYPYVLRDIAVWTPAGTTPGDVEDIIADTAGDLLVSINLFDTYEKDKQVSYAFKLVFQSSERTLRDEEVNDQMHSIEEALEDNSGFSVR